MSVDFDTDLIVRYGGRGPRYTSYPTALQLTESFSADEYCAAAIASNETAEPLSLYVHIPFCHSLCYYCGCNKIITRNDERVARYMQMLYREIKQQATLFSSARKIEQLHFGGGTPTYLDARQLRELMQKLRGAFTFDDSDNREFSIEVDPRTVDAQRIHELADLGFNRLSLGIQDFDQGVQEAVNRIQSVAEVDALIDAARGCGFRSVSFDLIYGLPRQSLESFDETLDQVVRMRPDRLAVYNYAHLPLRFKGQRMINELDIPSPDDKLALLHRTIDRLCDAGYEYIGMDHFALPEDELVKARENGSLQRNFQGYSTHRHCDLIALGVSAISNIGNMFSQNAITTMEYEAMLEAGQLPLKKGLFVDADDQRRAAVIQALMCYDELTFADFEGAHNIGFREYFAAELQRLRPLADDGLILLTDTAIRITDKGRLLLRSIAMVFDRYIDQAENDKRFSKAI